VLHVVNSIELPVSLLKSYPVYAGVQDALVQWWYGHNAVIFAFVGNAIFMSVYHSLQRLCKARMFSDFLGKFHFWGWQIIIVAAALTLISGITTSKEYAELEWPIDIAIALVWIAFGINMFGTIIRRREKHMYVSIWFYIATFVTVTVLHVVNSIELPVSAVVVRP
jgi:cytochrome c oxidase cbb3-type subunit I/II